LYTYIIVGDGLMAHPFKSDLNWFEFVEYIKDHSVKTHPKGQDTVWCWGTIEFMNPRVMMLNDFANYMAGIL
jgi:hypothetical protein